IDEEIYRKLERLRLPPSGAAGDEVYLRRVSLDLTGTLPTPKQVRDWLADDRPDRKERKIDDLLASEAFVDYWTLRFATWLQVRALPKDRETAQVYHNWLREQIRMATPCDELAWSLLTATGDAHKVGPANFTRMASDARQHAELASRAFMGVRLQCANCHNHPLDRWTQDDYHGLAAVFARLDRGRQVKALARGDVTNPRTGDPAVPRLPGFADIDPDSDRPAAFARWLTQPENPYFSRALVNRLWHSMFGRGLVEPVDDLRATNPPSHPELLDRLAADFIDHGCDIRGTLRMIALSDCYGRDNQPLPQNRDDARFYSHAWQRPLSAEVLADAIACATGVAEPYGDQPLGVRAVQLYDPQTPSATLDILGRCSREEACESGSAPRGLPARLHLLNGRLVNGKLRDDRGRLMRLIAEGRSNEQIVTEFYLCALSRYPSKAEFDYWDAQLPPRGSTQRRDALEDFAWALLNSSEFATNH
ncbi:MAG: DUF1553 domain-containing protein, partial [Planctomycetota bacterium]